MRIGLSLQGFTYSFMRENSNSEHWFQDYKTYWAAFLAIVLLQAGLTAYTLRLAWSPLQSFFILFFVFVALNNLVSVIILVLTWPARRNFNFSRYIKILIAFSAIYFISVIISAGVTFYRGN
jgi:hypothetical protein